MMKRFPLRDGVTNRQVLAAIRLATKTGCEKWNIGVEPNESLSRRGHERRYIFGIGTPLRDTLIAAYTVNSGYIEVVFPNHYKYWEAADVYTQLRVHIYDLILHHKPFIHDATKPGVRV